MFNYTPSAAILQTHMLAVAHTSSSDMNQSTKSFYKRISI